LPSINIRELIRRSGTTITWSKSDRTRRNGFKLKAGGFSFDARKTFFFFYSEGSEASAEASQRSCGCPIPGGVQLHIVWGPGHPHLVGRNHTHSRRLELHDL